ncbi:MAG: (d)CMP kinase [Actinobacteria bacterium]|nr:(d)CMP kinase [Actinomycetota bacterium]
MPAPDAAASRRPFVVAVDGPSGSGKSSVSREVARRLGVGYLDTGAMYRAVCWSILDAGIELTDAAAVADRARTVDLVVGTDPDTPTVVVEGTDVTAAIRETRISAAVSAVATNLEVRAELRRRQREIIEAERDGRGGVVAEGRDITTVVAPDADVRILLTADERARLARRAREVHGSDDESALAATRDQVLRRDADDSTVSSFHEAADGVLHLDSSDLSFEETVGAVLDVVLETVEGTPGKAASSGSVVADLVAAARVDGEPDTLTVDLEGTLTGAGGRSGTAS